MYYTRRSLSFEFTLQQPAATSWRMGVFSNGGSPLFLSLKGGRDAWHCARRGPPIIIAT